MVRGITLSFYGVPRKSANLFLDFRHRWASTSTSMSAISDIDICYSDIGDKYVGQKNVIPISEVFRYWHQSSFQYPTLKKKIFKSADANPHPSDWKASANTELLRLCVHNWMSDIGYRIKLYSEIRYNFGLHSLCPILEVPISGSVRYRWSRISD